MKWSELEEGGVGGNGAGWRLERHGAGRRRVEVEVDGWGRRWLQVAQIG